MYSIAILAQASFHFPVKFLWPLMPHRAKPPMHEQFVKERKAGEDKETATQPAAPAPGPPPASKRGMRRQRKKEQSRYRQEAAAEAACGAATAAAFQRLKPKRDEEVDEWLVAFDRLQAADEALVKAKKKLADSDRICHYAVRKAIEQRREAARMRALDFHIMD
jgi:hypothetical protein